MRVIFMGTPEFSVPVLDALFDAGHEIAAVYSQPPRPAGRGKKERPSPVQARAEVLGLEVRCPTALKSPEAQQAFVALQADVAVVVAYGLILPQAILDAPKRGCLNIHASLLPRWRGAAPIHRAIMAGDAKTGVCIMQMDAGLDTGPVVLRQEIAILDGETTGKLHDRLADLGAKLIVAALDRGQLQATPQSDVGVTYAAKIDKAEAKLDWAKPAEEVARLINGLSPFPGAWCDIAGERVKFLEARAVKGVGQPGEVMEGFTIACGVGAVQITQLQRAGKSRVAAEDALHGMQLPKSLATRD